MTFVAIGGLRVNNDNMYPQQLVIYIDIEIVTLCLITTRDDLKVLIVV